MPLSIAGKGDEKMATGKRHTILFFLIFILLTGRNVFSQSVWNWVQPKPTGNLLYSVHFINQSTGYACGTLGTIIKTTNRGIDWVLLNSSTERDLSEIFFTDEKSGFAVGNEGTIIITTDGGEQWSIQPSGTLNDLHDITFTNKTTGFTCGLNGTILKTTDSGNTWDQLMTNTNAPLFCMSFLNENTGMAGGYNIIIKTTNGGTNWITQNANIISSSSVVGISITDSNTIYAGGNSPGGVIYKSTNAGMNWQHIPLGLPYLFGGSVDLLRNISFVNNNMGFAVTDFGTILMTTDAGINWKRDSSFRPSYTKLSVMYDIRVLDPGSVYIAGGGGTVIASTNTGMNWVVLTGNKNTLRADYFIDQKTGYCAGENGVILRTTNSGMNWTDLKSPADIFFKSVFFYDAMTGFFGGDSGKIFKTTDGGNNFLNQFTTRQQNVNSIYFADENTGVAAGGSDQRAFIYRTSNGGYNWYEVFDSVSYGDLNCIGSVSNAALIITGDNGNTMKTTDAGESWNSSNIAAGDLKSISFADGINGLIAGAGGLILKTTNGGINWTMLSGTTFRTLNTIKYFPGGTAISAGDEGVIITSKNGGKSWTPCQRITNNNFYSVNIPFNGNFIAFGEYGTIVNSVLKTPSIVAIANNSKEKRILTGNYPNPFNPVTNINYQITAACFVTLKVYNILGEEVIILVNERQPEGVYTKQFDGLNLASGIYFYSLYLDGKTAGTNRMVLLK